MNRPDVPLTLSDIYVPRHVTKVTNDEGAVTAEFLFPGDCRFAFQPRYDEDGTPMQIDPIAALEEVIQMRQSETQALIDDPHGFKPQIAQNQKLIALLRQEQEQYRPSPNA